MCYTYDSLNRVTKRTIKNLSNVVLSEESFTYDAASNITDAPDSCFEYDTNNRLTKLCGNDVSYDLDGNMLSNGSLTCTYDSANRLTSAGGHTYTYNAENIRIRNLCSDADTTYVYDTNAKLSKLLCKTTNGITTKYVYGRGLIGEEKCGEFKTYHFDCRGSTIAITDASGNITDTFAYDTYGKLINRTGTSKVIFSYNGRDGVVTDDNGLIYMRARYYSPEMKRFINADIIPGKLSNAVTLNRFAYANGNPVSNVDPFGLAPNMFINACVKYDGGGSIKPLNLQSSTTSAPKSPTATAPATPIIPTTPSHLEQATIKDGSSNNNYIYSSEPYWEDLLTNNDAIYVVEYSLDVVGHAYVYLKVDNHNGNPRDDYWIKTEFNTTGGDTLKEKKGNAIVTAKGQTTDQIIYDLSREFVTETQNIPLANWEWWQPTVTFSYGVSGVQYVPIKGDFSNSVAWASHYARNDRKYGGYFLPTNNCLHYVKEILSYGEADNRFVEDYLNNSIQIVPTLYYDSLNSITQNDFLDTLDAILP